MQLELDPREVPVDAAPLSASHTLSPKLRAFGFVPDVTVLRPGDLILVRPIRPTIASRVIEFAQTRAGFVPDNARWTHAAVHLYDGMVIEAAKRPGIVQRRLEEDVPKNVMRIRRVPGFSNTDMYEMALRATTKLGQKYANVNILMLGLAMLQGLWKSARYPSERSINICSVVHSDAYSAYTGRILEGCSIENPPTPAHLSATRSLVDVDVGWRKLKARAAWPHPTTPD